MLMPRTSDVPHVFEKDHRGSSRAKDLADVPEKRSPRLFHSALKARLRERLAGEASGQNIVGGHVHPSVGGGDDVATCLHPPVALVDRGRFVVLLDRVDACSAERSERSVK